MGAILVHDSQYFSRKNTEVGHTDSPPEYREVQQLLGQDIAAYERMIRELDELAGGSNAMLMKTRATIWIWSRSHARLAQGITDPAKFDIMGVAKQAMDAAMPF